MTSRASPKTRRLLAAGIIAGSLLLAAARPALAWGDKGHLLITEEAVQRLPQPLRGMLVDGGNLRVLKDRSLAPDRRVAALKESVKAGKAKDDELQAERTKHFFDIDAITTEPPPFKDFPRDRAAAEKKFGAAALEKFGSVPWVAADAFASLVAALKNGRTDAIFDAAGDLSHFTADLHQPLHITKNYNGQLTGNAGIHEMLEIGLVNRYLDFYAAEARKDRQELIYMDNVQDPIFDWLVEAHGRVAPILEADTAARKKTGYAPPEKKEDYEKELDDLGSARAKPYYAAFKAELEARGSPEAAAMRDSAAHLARLYYSAWVQAGKPLSLAAPAPVEKAAEKQEFPLWLMVLALMMLAMLFIPRRAPRQ